jgi:hypothetical protein
MIRKANHFIHKPATYCTMFWVLDHFWSPVVCVTLLKTPVRLSIGLFTIFTFTRNYTHLQLSITLLHIYTAYNLTRS